MVKFPKRSGKELLYKEFLFAYTSIDLHTYKKVVSGFLMFSLYLQFSGSYQAFQKFLSRGQVLVIAIITDCAAGQTTQVSAAIVAVPFAFLAGNVLKEALPEERHIEFSAFLCGAAAYSILLLVP